MQHYFEEFYNLMEQGGLGDAESFSAYMVDVIAPNVQNSLYLDGFEWDSLEEAMIDGDFEQMITTNRISVMATYADSDSEVIPFGTEGFSSYLDSIPTMKTRYLMSEKEYRKKLKMIRQLQGQGRNIKGLIMDLLFNSMKDMLSHYNNSMTYQRDQIVSNTAGLVITKTDNNPQGISYTFQSRVPAVNISTPTGDDRWFTDAGKTAEGSTSNPPEECKAVIRTMRNKGIANIVLEVDEETFFEDVKHSKWLAVIGYNLDAPTRYAGATIEDAAKRAAAAAGGANDSQIVNAVSSYLGVPIRLSNRIVGIEKYDKTAKKLVRTTLRSFVQDVWVFRIDGRIGGIKSILPIVADKTQPIAPVFGGRGLIQYQYDQKSKIQDWWGEASCLCAPEAWNDMYYIKPLGI